VAWCVCKYYQASQNGQLSTTKRGWDAPNVALRAFNVPKPALIKHAALRSTAW